MDTVSDRELVLKFRAGATTMFEVLVRRYEAPLYRFFRRHSVSPSAADDLFQETCLRVYQGIGGFDAAREFRPWLYTVALNCLRRGIARRGPHVPSPADPPPDPPARDPAPAEIAQAGELAERVRLAVQELPDGPREVFLLYQYQGLSYAEIAESVQRPLGTVKSQMHTALEQLRRSLSAYRTSGEEGRR